MRLRSVVCWPTGVLTGLLLTAVFFCGCSSNHYRRSADKEVYGIIQEYDNRIFGRTNDFTIDTRYSHRDPNSIISGEIILDRSTTNRRVLTLEHALGLAVQNSREYQTQKEQLYLRALTLTGARYQYSPRFSAFTTPELTGSRSGAVVGRVNSRLGVSQLLKTGGTLTLTLGNDLLHYFTRGFTQFGTRNTAINFISVDLSQPLLRGFGLKDPRLETLTQSERDVAYAVRAFSRYQHEFAVETVSAYFALLTQKSIVRNNFRNYTNRVDTTAYLEARSVDRERRSDVDDARTAELGAKSDYIDSLANYLRELDSFKLRLGVPISEEIYLSDDDLKELIEAGLIPVNIDREAAFRICVDNQTEIVTAIDTFEDRKRKVVVAADQLRADMKLLAGADVSSTAPYDYAHFDMNNLGYYARLNLDLPVDRFAERNVYRRSLIDFQAELRALALTLDSYRNRIDSGLRTVEQNRLQYLNGEESLKVALRRVENTTMLLEAGRATIRDVREAQDGLILAQNNLATYYRNYLVARLTLLLNIGVIETESPKFWLLDPLKGKLTPEQQGEPPLRMPDNQVLPPENFLEPPST
jgi:outer membrane protein TolC